MDRRRRPKLITATAFCVSLAWTAASGCQAATGESPPGAPSLVLSAEKTKVEAIVRASVDIPSSFQATQIVFFAPQGTFIWASERNICRASSVRSQTLTLVASALTEPLCWQAEEEQSGRLLARLTSADHRTAWITSPSVEFSNRWFDKSFVAGVASTLLGALIAGLGFLMQLRVQDYRESAKARRELELKTMEERAAARQQAQKFLASNFLPAVGSWRGTLEAWEPSGTNPPRKLDLSGSYQAQDQVRATQFATYFAELDSTKAALDVKALHTLAARFNKEADRLNVPFEADDATERQMHQTAAQEIRDQLLQMLVSWGF